MNILVLRFSSMGDIIVQTPFLRWLKTSFPKATINFLTLDANADLINETKLIDRLHLFSKKESLRKRVKEIAKENKIDLIIDLHGTTRSFLTRCFLWDIPSISVDKRRLERFFLVKFKMNFLKDTPSQHSRSILDFKNIFNRIGLTEYSMESNALKKESEEDFFIIAPGASFESKRYPIEDWIILTKKILEKYKNLKCKILAGPDDIFCSEFDSLEAEFKNRIENLQGQRKLKESIKEVEGVKFLICNDSLMSHIAQSADIPALVFFGPTSQSFGFGPIHSKSKSFSVDNLKCRPCSTTGSKKCTQKELLCFKEIDKELVIDHIDSIMDLKC